MKLFRQIAMAGLALSSAAAANAQQVTISPVPQNVQWGGKAFSADASCFLTGNPDAATSKLLAKHFSFTNGGAVELVVGTKGDASVAAYAGQIPSQAEGYYLSVTPNKVVVAGADNAGTFYGVQSLLQVMSAPEVQQVTVTDWPTTAKRGVIEGFYGNPWSFDDRVSQFEFYGANKMNIYVYGPKDDPYHHSKWYELYPEAEAAQMKELVQHATDNNVKFVWAMHPSNSISSDSDRQKALAKFEQMYGLGVRAFSIFFDDISAESVDAQVSYLNFLTDNFVNKKSDVEQLVVCPTQYNKGWSSGNYLSTMGKGLYSGIQIMWTGNSVVDMIQKDDCTWFTGQTGRKPFIWLNYPVNDYGQHNLLMGPVEGNGTDISDYIEAFCSNPMQYAEASKVALYSLADFAWNPKAYDANAAWERSLPVLMPEAPEAFRRFCISNVDLAPNTHGLRLYNETPEFKALQDKYSDPTTAEAVADFSAYFDASADAAATLLALESSNRMVPEIKEFIECFGYQATRGRKAMDMQAALTAGNSEEFIAAYTDYKAALEASEALLSRGFQGSIQSVKPQTATLYVEPFIKSRVSTLIDQFKNSGATYPDGLFPAQVLENGLYYIMYDGKYLTNVNGSSYPTFVAEEDNVNPGRQLWQIAIDPETGRYSIKNEWDKRYVNELGNFGNPESTTNPYEAVWHTYNIGRFEGKYSIQNAGSAKTAYWTTDGTRISPRSENGNPLATDFRFTILKSDKSEPAWLSILGQKCYLLNKQGLAFTFKGKAEYGAFEPVIQPADDSQLFGVALDTDVNRYRMMSIGGKCQVNENGRIGYNAYSADWNTYILCENGENFAIQNTASGGTSYWVPGMGEGSCFSYSGSELKDSYVVRIVPFDQYSGISDIVADDNAGAHSECIYDLTGRRVTTPGHGFYIVGGKKVVL